MTPFRSAHSSHQHLLAAIATELPRFADRETIRILDVGCGHGDLLSDLYLSLVGTPDNGDTPKIELEGFDLRVENRPEFPAETLERLGTELPEYPWRDRISAIGPDDPWPYKDETFDVLVSNQVLEHVMELEPFLREVRRVLKPGGVSVNLFPLNKPMEGHTRMPFVHWLSGRDQLVGLLALWDRLGVGKLKGGKIVEGLSRQQYAAIRADYLYFSVQYRPLGDFKEVCKRIGLRLSYRYSAEFPLQKVRALLSRPSKATYRFERNPLLDWLAFTGLRYLVTPTLIFERPEADGVWLLLKRHWEEQGLSYRDVVPGR